MARSKDVSRSYAQVFQYIFWPHSFSGYLFCIRMCMTPCYASCMSNRKQSSTSNTVWTVRGVAHETRTAVAVAAKRAGQSVGEWTTRAVMDAITTQTGNRNVPAHRVEDVLARVVERLEALEKTPRPSGFWDWLIGRKSS
ncbi:MAG: hypothetical protein ABL996_22330 [Micropepsaceae bacterium]